MAQAYPTKEANPVKKLNGRSLLISANKKTRYFKEWTTGRGRLTTVLKKIYYLYKYLMLQIDPISSSCSQKLQYPERKLRLLVIQKRSSLGKVDAPKVTLATANVYSRSSKKFTILNE